MAKRKPKKPTTTDDGPFAQVPYRAQHRPLSDDRGPVVASSDQQVVDVEGNIGDPKRVFDTLAALHRNRSIDDAAHDAGRRFEEDFRFAHLDPQHAPDLARIPGMPARDWAIDRRDARDRVAAIMHTLGGYTSPAGSCCWWVLGCGQTLREYAQNTVLLNGRTMSEQAAKWTLVAALDVLAVHYGLKGTAESPLTTCK